MRAKSVMFMAIAVALVVIAVVVFARGGHDLVLAPHAELSLVGEQTPLVRTMTHPGVNAGVVVALVPVRRFARLDRA